MAQSQKKQGRIIITLEEYRLRHGISKNKIVLNANVQRTQLQKYLSNNVARVDLGVLARICDYLDCEISDILKYERPGTSSY